MKFRTLIQENKGFIAFMLGMFVVRCAFADFFIVPSSSMYPTLLEGDRVICNRVAYDFKVPFTDIVLKSFADPQRGDVVTFSSPEDGTRLVKRLIAVPGDIVELRENRLTINGIAASYAQMEVPSKDYITPEREFFGKQLVYKESLGEVQHGIILMPERMSLNSFGPLKVPAGEYLMLGDNRDNSKDSRYIGFVKRELITGRVQHLLFSLDGDNYYSPRFARFGAKL